MTSASRAAFLNGLGAVLVVVVGSSAWSPPFCPGKAQTNSICYEPEPRDISYNKTGKLHFSVFSDGCENVTENFQLVKVMANGEPEDWTSRIVWDEDKDEHNFTIDDVNFDATGQYKASCMGKTISPSPFDIFVSGKKIIK